MVDAREKRREIVETCQRKRRAEPLLDAIAQQAFGHGDLPVEDDTADGPGRHEVVRDYDASGAFRHRHHDILESSEPHEVGDALAHRRNRQGRSDARLNQLEQRRIGHRPGVDGERLADDRLPEGTRQRQGLRHSVPGQRQAGARGKDRAHPGEAHQNTYLTRTSRAYVRSSFCDNTHDSRSLWSYSSRITWSRVVDDADSDCENVR